MTEQQSDPLLRALRSHGTHFFLFLLVCADGLAAAFGFGYGATVCAWLLSFLYWLTALVDFYVHRDLLATLLVAALIVTTVGSLIYQIFKKHWQTTFEWMITFAIIFILLWFLLEAFGVTFGHPGSLVTWIPSLRQVPFPNPFPLWPFHLWPLWQWTGMLWALWYLYSTHRKVRSSRPQVNVKTVRIRLATPEPSPTPAESGVDPLHQNLNTNETGGYSWQANRIVDAVPTPKPNPEPQYRDEVRVFPLSVIHEHSEQWNILEECYKGYREALKRFRTPPLRRLRIPPRALTYSGQGKIGWYKHQLVLPDMLFLPEYRALLSCYLAHEISFIQGIDLWVRDLLTHYPSETRGLWKRLLIGNALVIPTLIKVWYEPGWQYDRTLDADVFAQIVGREPFHALLRDTQSRQPNALGADRAIGGVDQSGT